MRIMLVVFSILIFMFVILYTLSGANVVWSFKVSNPVSNVGGWLFGVFLGFAMMPRVRA
jgi:hypothetical protein